MFAKVRGIVLGGLFISMMMGLSAQEVDPPPPEESEVVIISRVLGDQFLNIALGLQIPLIIQNPTGQPPTSPINLELGGSGALAWGAFLGNNFSLGIDISASYSGDINGKGFFAVPIGIHGDYFFRFAPFELPIHLGLGLHILSYNDIVSVGMMIKTGLSFYWNAFEDWSFGLNVMYWWLPELYLDSDPNTPPSSMNRFGNFLEITLSAMYNF